MAIHERIKALRKSLGLTQIEFGRKIGIVQGHLTGIESGDKKITETTLKVTCAVYGASEEWLRTGKGEMFTNNQGGKIYKVLDYYNQLLPQYQNFVLEQIEELFETQKKQD
ncbi:MAG: helix-turn-helix domain-containing protein [Chitinispirillia bacterium]|nr:helix-turn-helix domain-containing protein [Chitinispirillia bacterium]